MKQAAILILVTLLGALADEAVARDLGEPGSAYQITQLEVSQVEETGLSGVRAVAQFDVAADPLWRELMHYERLGSRGNLLRVGKIAAAGETASDINLEIRLPWPFAKISCVLTFEPDATERSVRFHRKSGCLEDVHGAIEVQSNPDGRTRLTYAMDIGSAFLPHWLLQWGIERALLAEFKRLAAAGRG